VATERVAASGARPGPEAFDAGALAGAHVIAGTLDGGEIRLGIAVSRFNAEVTTRLLAGARSACERHGIAAEAVSVAVVPGAFELPLAAQALAHSGVDAVVCLGAVIRGETTHYDLIAGEAAAGCQRVQLDTGVPVAFGVLTTENLDQALARAGGELGNKGEEAVDTAIEMTTLLRGTVQLAPGVTGPGVAHSVRAR
jgi:6,7-dimethyl-8-ribityllumazine synthase